MNIMKKIRKFIIPCIMVLIIISSCKPEPKPEEILDGSSKVSNE